MDEAKGGVVQRSYLEIPLTATLLAKGTCAETILCFLELHFVLFECSSSVPFLAHNSFVVTDWRRRVHLHMLLLTAQFGNYIACEQMLTCLFVVHQCWDDDGVHFSCFVKI